MQKMMLPLATVATLCAVALMTFGIVSLSDHAALKTQAAGAASQASAFTADARAIAEGSAPGTFAEADAMLSSAAAATASAQSLRGQSADAKGAAMKSFAATGAAVLLGAILAFAWLRGREDESPRVVVDRRTVKAHRASPTAAAA